MALLSGNLGVLPAWKAALDLLPGRMMGTCRHLLGPGLGWESGKMALRGRWCLKFRSQEEG